MKGLLVCGIALGSFLQIACSSAPQGAKPGSPAFFWAVAGESYRTGDLLKTDATLLDLAGTDSPYAAKARVWQLVISAGLTQGFSDLADAYDKGSGQAPSNSLQFRKQTSRLRSLAATTALEFTQAVHDFLAGNQDPDVLLAFCFPPGSPTPPEDLLKIAAGAWPSDSDRDLVQTAMLQRGVVRAVSAALGAPGNPARAEEAFRAVEVRVSRDTFLEGMARLLYEDSTLFGPSRMDRPDRLMVMCREAKAALQPIPPTDARKELAAQIEATLKKISGI